MRVHRDDKPFKCKTCGQSVKTIFLKMLNMIHTKDDKPFRCETCGKSVKENRTLKKHTMMHTKDISRRQWRHNKQLREGFQKKPGKLSTFYG